MIAITHRPPRLELSGETWPVRNAIAQIPDARWDAARKTWTVPATPAGADAAQRVGGVLDPGAEELREVFADRLRRLAEARNGHPPPALPFEPARPAWRHQLAGHSIAWPAGGCLLHYGMGSGKTRIALDLIRSRGYRRVLIVCPLAVVPTWAEEAEKYGHSFPVVPLASGSVAKRAQVAAAALKDGAVLVVNYDVAWRAKLGALIMETPWELVVCDEIQRIKSPGAKASLYLSRLADRVPHRLGLSGTPCPNTPLEAYGSFRFLDKAVFGCSYARFKGRYAVERLLPNGIRIPVGLQNEAEFNRRYYSITHRVDRDVLDLPDALDVERVCELPSEAQAIYNSLRDDLIAHVRGGTVTADNALVKLLRLQQVASGHVGTDDGSEVLHGAKGGLLAELFDELPPAEPVVVFARFLPDLDAVHAASRGCKRSSLELSGRRNQLAEWKAGGAPVLAVQIQAGGVGVDLTRAAYAVFWSQTFSLGDYEQARARLHRPGQHRAVTYIHLLAHRTVDQGVYRALGKKQSILDLVLAEPRRWV